ncbi:hypothetical protein BROUX41_000247 [Berkeleyomyces rouxiae]
MMQWDNGNEAPAGGEDWFNQLGTDLNAWNNNSMHYGLEGAAPGDAANYFSAEDIAASFEDLSSFAGGQDVLGQTFDPAFFGQDAKTALSGALNNVADLHQEGFSNAQQQQQQQQPQFGFDGRPDQPFSQGMQAFAGPSGSVATSGVPPASSVSSATATAPVTAPQARHGQSASTTPVQHQPIQNKPPQPTHHHGAFQNGMAFSQPSTTQQGFPSGAFPVSSAAISTAPIPVTSQPTRPFGQQQDNFNPMTADQQMLQAQKIQALQNQHQIQQQQSRSPSVQSSQPTSAPAPAQAQPLRQPAQQQQQQQQQQPGPSTGYHMMQQAKGPHAQAQSQAHAQAQAQAHAQAQAQVQAQFQAAAQFQHAQEAQYQARLQAQTQAQLQRPQAAIQKQPPQQQPAGGQPNMQYLNAVRASTPGSQSSSQMGTPQQQHRIPSPQIQQPQNPGIRQIQQQPQQQQQALSQSSIPGSVQAQAQAQAQAQFQFQQQQQQIYLQQQSQPQQQQHIVSSLSAQSVPNQQQPGIPAASGVLHVAKSVAGQAPGSRSITPQGLKRSADDSAAGSPAPSESSGTIEPAKKRTKRTTKKDEMKREEDAGAPAGQLALAVDGQTGSYSSSSATENSISSAPINSAVSSEISTPASPVDLLGVPKLTKVEMEQLTHHTKKSRASKLRPSPIPGAEFMASTGTIKLSNLKSFDKLNPMIAMPSQSGRPIIKELSSLPCEIQGRFAARFRPSTNACGIDERRMESSMLLDLYDQSMAALGKRRPKYTEYPHAFKEQLRADETVKSKADRHARKLADEEKGAPLRADMRPSDEIEAAVWDLVDLVHIKSDAVRTSALLGKAVQQTGDFIAGVRVELSKSRTALDNATKEKKPESVLATLRQTLDLKKAKLLRVLESANSVGDEVVLESLGGHAKFVISMINTLIFCVKAGDYTDKLLKTALETMMKLKFAPSAANALANFEPVRKRLYDNGDANLRSLVKQIADKIVELDQITKKNKESATTTSASSSSGKKPTPTEDKSASDGSGANKIASGTTSTTAAVPKARAGSALLPGKSRAAVAKPLAKDISKTDPIKALEEKKVTSTQLKKPLSRPEAPRSDASKPITSTIKPSSSGFSSAGGFASLMQSINAPKAKSPPKDSKATPEPVETAEEKEKRLRKEARRKLRVRWRSDHELVQVREFKKEESDDEDREKSANLTKDAGDDKSEGMALRQRPIVDEEDEDDLPYIPWMEPTPVDLSVIDERYRAKTFVKRGGKLPFESKARDFLVDRESRVLMAFYSDVSDIPPTPKSPPPEPAADGWQPRIGHLPREDKYEEIQRRLREVREMGPKGALYNALRRVEVEEERLRASGLKPSNNIGIPPSGTVIIHGNAGPVFLDSVGFLADGTSEKLVAMLVKNLAALNKPFDSAPQSKRRDDYGDVGVQAAADAVEDLAALFVGKVEASEPPKWLAEDEARANEWRSGYIQDASLRALRATVETAYVEVQGQTSDQNAIQSQSFPQTTDMPAGMDPTKLAEMYNLFIQAQQIQGNAQMPNLEQLFAGNMPPQDQMMAAMELLKQFGTTPYGGAASAQVPSGPLAYTPSGQNEDPYMARLRMKQEADATADATADASDGNVQNSTGEGGDWDDEYDPTREDWEMHDADSSAAGNRDRGLRDNSMGGPPTGPGAGAFSAKRKKPAKGALPPHRPSNRALIGTKPCMFFKQGICARGEKCTFRHDI